MGNVKIPYYVVRKGRGYWKPTPAMRALGFANIPCGPDGSDAWAQAQEWNRKWQSVRRGEDVAPAMAEADNLSPERLEQLTVYPHQSIGAAFRAYRATPEWARKALRTREDWWRAWKRIKPVFGDVDPRAVDLEDVSAFRQHVEESVSLREAHRTIKIWRALWKVMAALHYCQREADPSLGVRNSAARGRSETWTEGEAARLFKRAWRMGYYGLGAAIAAAWSTMLSPGDVRALRASQVAQDGTGVYFTERGKTGTPVGGSLSNRAMAALAGYLDQIGVELAGEAFIFRNRSGQPYSKDTLGDDFRAVRAAEFGEADRRQLADFRRSGAVEAIAGGAQAEQLAHAMGNTLGASNALYATYVPVNRASIRAVVEARRKGRQGNGPR
jgi:hypothetical protein